MLVKTAPRLEGNLDDILEGVEKSAKDSVKAAFARKENAEHGFHIPAADKENCIVTFTTREMLTRFATLYPTTQKEFLQGVRKALKEGEVTAVYVTVPWGDGTKVIMAQITNNSNHLRFVVA